MTAEELRAMTGEELRQSLDESCQELFNLRFQLATQQLADSSRIRQVRRDIARARTVLRELELRPEVQ